MSDEKKPEIEVTERMRKLSVYDPKEFTFVKKTKPEAPKPEEPKK